MLSSPGRPGGDKLQATTITKRHQSSVLSLPGPKSVSGATGHSAYRPLWSGQGGLCLASPLKEREQGGLKADGSGREMAGCGRGAWQLLPPLPGTPAG